MPIAGSNRYSYQAEITPHRRLRTDRIELTMVDFLSVDDAIPRLLNGERVRVDARGGVGVLRLALLKMGAIVE